MAGICRRTPQPSTISALAYVYARRHVHDERFAFGTGKLGDLASFGSAIILGMIALLIGYESIVRLLHPVAIYYDEAIAIAALGLLVNLVSAWLLRDGHAHDHHHHHGHADDDGALSMLTAIATASAISICARLMFT